MSFRFKSSLQAFWSGSRINSNHMDLFHKICVALFTAWHCNGAMVHEPSHSGHRAPQRRCPFELRLRSVCRAHRSVGSPDKAPRPDIEIADFMVEFNLISYCGKNTRLGALYHLCQKFEAALSCVSITPAASH